MLFYTSCPLFSNHIIDGSWMPRYLATRDCATAASSSENKWAISASVFDRSIARLNSSMAFSKHPLQQWHDAAEARTTKCLQWQLQTNQTILTQYRQWETRIDSVNPMFDCTLLQPCAAIWRKKSLIKWQVMHAFSRSI